MRKFHSNAIVLVYDDGHFIPLHCKEKQKRNGAQSKVIEIKKTTSKYDMMIITATTKAMTTRKRNQFDRAHVLHNEL